MNRKYHNNTHTNIHANNGENDAGNIVYIRENGINVRGHRVLFISEQCVYDIYFIITQNSMLFYTFHKIRIINSMKSK